MGMDGGINKKLQCALHGAGICRCAQACVDRSADASSCVQRVAAKYWRAVSGAVMLHWASSACFGALGVQ